MRFLIRLGLALLGLAVVALFFEVLSDTPSYIYVMGYGAGVVCEAVDTIIESNYGDKF